MTQPTPSEPQPWDANPPRPDVQPSEPTVQQFPTQQYPPTAAPSYPQYPAAQQNSPTQQYPPTPPPSYPQYATDPYTTQQNPPTPQYPAPPQSSEPAGYASAYPSMPVTRTSTSPSQVRTLLLTGLVAALVSALVTSGVLLTRKDSASSSSISDVVSAAGTGPGPVKVTPGAGIDWPTVAKAVQPSVVAIAVNTSDGGGQGSGVILDKSGRIFTNNHVVAEAADGAGEIEVSLSDGRNYPATVVGTDPSTDIAVIKMDGATDLIPATLGDSDQVFVGAPVMALGNPLGLASTVTTGIVSALNRPVTTGDRPGAGAGGEVVVTNAIQTDAAVNPGNSGGALVDSSGRVVGVPSSIASLGQSSGGQGGSIGLGFAIPINEAKSIVDQLIEDGTADHPFLGVKLQDGRVRDGSASRAVALITTVNPGTPAEKAGLKAGDAVTAVAGETVNGRESLVAQIRERRVGATVKLSIIRGGSETRDGTKQEVPVSFTEAPKR